MRDGRSDLVSYARAGGLCCGDGVAWLVEELGNFVPRWLWSGWNWACEITTFMNYDDGFFACLFFFLRPRACFLVD